MPFDIDSLDRVALRIRSMRTASGISQKRLAKMCGLSQSTIARIETDIKSINPSYSTVYAIIDALNTVSKRSGEEKLLRKRAVEIMHRRIVFVKPNNTIQEAIDVFTDYDFQQLQRR
jgi:predicted transcriptional regulator